MNKNVKINIVIFGIFFYVIASFFLSMPVFAANLNAGIEEDLDDIKGEYDLIKTERFYKTIEAWRSSGNTWAVRPNANEPRLYIDSTDINGDIRLLEKKSIPDHGVYIEVPMPQEFISAINQGKRVKVVMSSAHPEYKFEDMANFPTDVGKHNIRVDGN